jgi:predicted PurR-regulated permease PerM
MFCCNSAHPSFYLLFFLPDAQGYFVDVPLDPDKANANLANILNNNWIDGQTRTLRVTLEAWNLQLDQVIVMFWDTEFNSGGHMRNFFSAAVVRVHYYDKPEDQLRLALEIIVVIFWLFYLFSEWEQVYKAYK